MSVAAFVLGVVAIVLAVVSLTWQVVELRLRGQRPQLTPVIGLLTPEGLLTNDASYEVRDALAHAAKKLPASPLIIGVKVVNAGRAPFHVAEWALRADPVGSSLVPVSPPAGSTEVPHDIPPGGSAVFVTELRQAHRLAQAADHVEGQPSQIVLTISSGARTYVTKPVAAELLSLGSP